ncbi:thioesterase [Mycobacterium mantenii]|uniref:PaaI family thioesterase n=1 Tax=Mycobacterium mantenii TaxID=560555 RepID=UPI0007FEA9C4|nr:PaaI family thioesterase [Mycobacterium mantenii]OBH58590.1 thioesterase [Mycobacterium mantenii]OBH72184.1 thioesterase [Mycobacterium mantenii]
MTDTHERLTESVRRLIDVTIRSEADERAVAKALALVDQTVELLSTRLMPGSFGVRTNAEGENVVWGNVAVGLRNPIAPPLIIRRDEAGGVHTDVHLGAGYEGPPGHVHGGMCALILDHVLGATAHQPGKPAYTGTITVRYLRPTPLGALRAEARVERVDGSKTYATGHLSNVDGVTVEAEGVFITPREHLALGERPPLGDTTR